MGRTKPQSSFEASEMFGERFGKEDSVVLWLGDGGPDLGMDRAPCVMPSSPAHVVETKIGSTE
jgi:hypothetical protein